MSKVFLIDINKCNGCFNCQLACKDEHCDQPWPPYAEAQPLTGQFWLKVNQKERGQVPVVRVSYTPVLGAQNGRLAEYAPEVLMEREDGLAVIDPAKAKGRKDIAELVEGVFWNEELQIPQGCTGCAHLLDNGWDVPRCVDSCPTDAILFVEESSIDKSEVEILDGAEENHCRVYYRNLPKRFVAGSVVDLEADELVVGTQVDLTHNGKVVASALTDEFGDFEFDQVEALSYTLVINGCKEVPADAVEQDICVGDIAL